MIIIHLVLWTVMLCKVRVAHECVYCSYHHSLEQDFIIILWNRISLEMQDILQFLHLYESLYLFSETLLQNFLYTKIASFQSWTSIIVSNLMPPASLAFLYIFSYDIFYVWGNNSSLLTIFNGLHIYIVKLGTSNHWVGTRTGADVIATLQV